KLESRKVAGPPIRRDAASVTRESCAWRDIAAETRVWSLHGLSSKDIMVNKQ
ncbi:unnamed protein product, partial [Brassica rapa subsp. narinosa]